MNQLRAFACLFFSACCLIVPGWLFSQQDTSKPDASQQDASQQDASRDSSAAPPEFRLPSDVPLPSGKITFTFENAQLQPARYQITVHSDGTGHFVSHVGSAPPDDIANLPAEGQECDIRITDATRDRLFAIAVKEKYFAMKCESSAKVAYQGVKVLAYEGPEGSGSCTYNYTQDAKLQWITAQLTGLAATLEEGRRLTVQHAHGRLVLDAELQSLAGMLHDGQATELQTIAPVLSAIIGDDDVMLRARRRAQVLLDSIPVQTAR